MVPLIRSGTVVLATAALVGASLVAATPAQAAAPAFVQQASAHGQGSATRAATMTANTAAGNRIIVEVGVWSSGNATATAVTDNAGDTFVKLVSFTASEHTELSVWTAVVATGGTKPVITATATASADIGLVALEYSGLSTVADASVVDRQSHATGTTGSASTVSSSATTAVSASNELAVGFYADSGFGSTLTAGSGYTQRAKVQQVSDMDMLVEDAVVNTGATPAATFGTSASTVWLAAVVVFRVPAAAATAPDAPTGVTATPGDKQAAVSWTAPADNGSTITSYTVTPYIGSTAQTPTTVTGTPAATNATVTGLTNGTAYTFRVTAANAIGTGPASAASAAVTPAVSTTGSFAALQSWPIVALSNVLLPNGNTVAWDGWQQPQPTVVWNPAQPSNFTTFNAPTSVFCDGAASLPDGRLLVAGGYGVPTTGNLGIADTYIFDYTNNSWTRVADMHYARWYPSVTETADGRYVAISGNDTLNTHWADTPEIYDPATNTWTLLTGVSTPQVHETEYPFTYLLPSGKLFTIGTNEDNSFLLDVNAKTWTPVGGASGIHNGSSVMYLPGKVMYSGGGADVNSAGPSYKTTSVIDLNAATPQWQQTAPMNSARIYHTLTMLPNGKVLSVGGASDTDQHIITTGQLQTEIWDPATQTWTNDATMAVSRNYHSTALLMPDGRVLVAGGGHPFQASDPGQFSAQYYSPAYLSAGPRPTITSSPAGTTYGSTFSVGTPDAADISAVNLVSLGADTHQLDMNQHFVPLNFTKGSGTLDVTAPASAGLAPPGYYMLFVLNSAGVPAMAKMIQIAANPTAPAAPTGVTAIPGNASATVAWTAPKNTGSPITGYTVTPYIGATAQTPTTVSGLPPATSVNITGLTNGTAYTFKVTATNGVGTSPASAATNAVTPGSVPPPTFIQQVSTQNGAASVLSVTPTANLTAGNRLIVQAGVWSSTNATISSVTDTAGDVFTKVASWKAGDQTEQSVWTAPITAGAGTKPQITAHATGTADVGVSALEYAGLSTVADATAVDQKTTNAGLTSGAGSVSSGATAGASSSNSLALGFYADSGFNTGLTGGSGWTVRGNMSPNGNMDLLTEEKTVAAGDTPNAAVGTGPNTYWLLGTLIFKPAATSAPTAPSAPTGVSATAGNGSATVTWTAPNNGGSALTSYTVTPYIGSTAQTPTTVTGTPPTTSAAISGLTNGTAYTFTVTATNAVGTSPASAASAAVTPTVSVPAPAFVQAKSTQSGSATTLGVTMTNNTTAGNRIVVEVGIWNSSSSVITGVTDNAGDTFTLVTSFTASDHAQISVWTAVVATGGTKPTITATAPKTADLGIAVAEYSGLSTATGTGSVDVFATGTGTTSGAATVRAAATAPTTAAGELAISFYGDSGFGTALSADAAYASRTNLSPNGNWDMLIQDATVASGATPQPGTGTGPATVWLMATVVFKHA